MKRVEALDGLRGVAVLMVVAHHLTGGAFPALGAAGVVVFFVLSGFLITRLLILRGVALRSFYVRRARRLLPALALVCGFVLVTSVQAAVLPAIGYYANYAPFFGTSMGALSHTWSLAVEEHFYVFFPLLLLAVRNRRRTVLITLLVVSLAWRFWATFHIPGQWVYRSTDTNAYALLAGCVIGLGREEGWIRPTNPMIARSALVAIVGSACLVGEIGIVVLPAIAALALLVVNASSVPLLETPVLRWFGTISYGLYLWSYVLIRSLPSTPLLATLLAVGAAWLSWTAVERPILDGRFMQRFRPPQRAASQAAAP